MKFNKKYIAANTIVFAMLIVLSITSSRAYCQFDNTVLVLQQTPPEGGRVTPATGVLEHPVNSELTLTAEPQPGFHFVVWLGDVSSPTTNRTKVFLDAPKIVIAVFERSEFDFLVGGGPSTSAPVGGLHRSPSRQRSPGGVSGGGGGGQNGHRERKYSYPFPVPEPGEESDEFPVPEPIPEPATIALTGAGAFWLLRRRRKACSNRPVKTLVPGNEENF